MPHSVLIRVLVGGALLLPVAAHADEAGERMHKLAGDGGCYLCHDAESRPPSPQELMPLAPSWADISRKYRGQKNAEDVLVRIVLTGTTAPDSDHHWTGKVSLPDMLPNQLQISESDAGSLVRWILAGGK